MAGLESRVTGFALGVAAVRTEVRALARKSGTIDRLPYPCIDTDDSVLRLNGSMTVHYQQDVHDLTVTIQERSIDPISREEIARRFADVNEQKTRINELIVYVDSVRNRINATRRARAVPHAGDANGLVTELWAATFPQYQCVEASIEVTVSPTQMYARLESWKKLLLTYHFSGEDEARRIKGIETIDRMLALKKKIGDKPIHMNMGLDDIAMEETGDLRGYGVDDYLTGMERTVLKSVSENVVALAGMDDRSQLYDTFKRYTRPGDTKAYVRECVQITLETMARTHHTYVTAVDVMNKLAHSGYAIGSVREVSKVGNQFLSAYEPKNLDWGYRQLKMKTLLTDIWPKDSLRLRDMSFGI